MIGRAALRDLARAHLRDAEILLQAGRPDGAVHLVGYAVELALKARICRTLNWPGFPTTSGEFEKFKSLKTHNLDALLMMSGREPAIKSKHFTDWNRVAVWDPEVRYKPVGSAQPADAQAMVTAARSLAKALS